MRKKINILLKLMVIFIAFSSILPSLLSNIWFIDILSNFKLQFVLILVFIFLINFFVTKDRLIIIFSIILIFWNCSFFYNLYVPSKYGYIHKLSGVTLTCVNLLSSNGEPKKVINYIKSENPDILVLLEYNPRWAKELERVTKSYQFHKAEIRTDNFGIGYFSRIESKLKIGRFDDTGVPSIIAKQKFYNDSVTIVATHPFPPVGQERFKARNQHLKNLAAMRKHLSKNLIIVGDLNTSSFSKHFKNFRETTKLKDSRNGYGILTTWPSNFIPMRTTLDHFLVSSNINVLKRGVGEDIGSDHLPINMEFRIKN